MGFPPGFEVMVGAQAYRPLGVRDHTKTDGTTVRVVDWETECADCGTTMRLFTLLRFKEPNRRCENCKAPGKPVRTKRRVP